MSARGHRFAREAQALVGTPFHLHGRTPLGLDCVGLVLLALERSGIATRAPTGYRLRNSDIAAHLDLARRNGFLPASGPVTRGDLVLVAPGPSQHHLMIALGRARFVHAHAGLRRVCEHCGPLPYPALHHWRLALKS